MTLELPRRRGRRIRARFEDDLLDLPYVNRVRSRGRQYYYFRPTPEMVMRGYRPGRLSPETARAFIKSVCERMRVLEIAPAPLPEPKATKQQLEKHAAAIHRSTKARAALKHVRYDLTELFILGLMEESGGRCQLTGIEFDLTMPGEGAPRRRPWAPSLDRKIPKAGYVPGNVRLICTMANLAVSDFGDEAFWQLVNSAVANRT